MQQRAKHSTPHSAFLVPTRRVEMQSRRASVAKQKPDAIEFREVNHDPILSVAHFTLYLGAKLS